MEKQHHLLYTYLQRLCFNLPKYELRFFSSTWLLLASHGFKVHTYLCNVIFIFFVRLMYFIYIRGSVANCLRWKIANFARKNSQNSQSVFIAFLCDNFSGKWKFLKKNFLKFWKSNSKLKNPTNGLKFFCTLLYELGVLSS